MEKNSAAERALAQANESLEQRVRARTQELTLLNAQLQQARAKAEAANSEKTRFLAAASHDLLQPLNAARLYTSSLVERTQGEAHHELARNIDASLNAVEDILSSLLDISKLDAGALPISLTSINAGDLLREIEVKFAPLAREKGLTLTLVPSSLYIRSDRALIGRALQNLVSNAVKYTPSGGRIVVGCRRIGDRVRLDVYDTGIGIPQASQNDIFKEFTRLDKGAKLSPGLGLGLSIVQRIITTLDHRLSVASQEGHGAHFGLTVARVNGLKPLAPQGENAVTSRANLAGMQVLCIDNEREILAGMTGLLAGWACDVKTALSLRHLVEAGTIEGWLPDIVLMDYHLDQTSGIDAIAWLRQHCGGNLPAVLVTAERSQNVSDQARALDIYVLHKPVKPAALRALLARHCGQIQGPD